VKFNKGIARLENGELFTGTILDKLKNGKQIELIYKNGELQESITDSFRKKYIKTTFDSGNGFFKIIKKFQKDTPEYTINKICHNTNGDIVLTEAVKNPEDMTKWQTKFFEFNKNGILKVSLKNDIDRVNPIVYSRKNGEKTFSATNDFIAKYGLKTGDDEGYKCYELSMHRK